MDYSELERLLYHVGVNCSEIPRRQLIKMVNPALVDELKQKPKGLYLDSSILYNSPIDKIMRECERKERLEEIKQSKQNNNKGCYFVNVDQDCMQQTSDQFNKFYQDLAKEEQRKQYLESLEKEIIHTQEKLNKLTQEYIELNKQNR